MKIEDVHTLRQCIEMEPDWSFEDIAKQVKFSKIYTAQELEQEWKQLLYHPTVQQINAMILYPLFVQQKYSHSFQHRQQEFLQQLSLMDFPSMDLENLVQEFQFSIFHPMKPATITTDSLKRQVIELEKELEMNNTNTTIYLESNYRKIAMTHHRILLGRRPKSGATPVVAESSQEQFIDLSPDLLFENKKEKSISRKQVLITLQGVHQFVIQNVGKKPITVNQTILEKEQSIMLQQLPIQMDCNGFLLQLHV